MTHEFLRNAKVVTVVHIGVILLTVFVPRLSGCVRRSPVVMPTELVVEISPDLIGPEQKKASDADKKTSDVKDELSLSVKEKKEKKTERTDKKQEKKPDKDLKRGKQEKVGQFVAAKNPKRLLTAEEIRKLLELGARPVEDGSGLINDAMYFEIIRRTMYAAWIQPKIAVTGLTTTMLFRLNPDGTIADRSMLQSSGNAAMDASVMEASRSVQQIPALSPDFLKRNQTVTVDFKLTGEANPNL